MKLTQAFRLVITWPIVLFAIPIAAWGDAKSFEYPDRYPARERILFYLSSWWHWTRTGLFHSNTMVLVDRGKYAIEN